ncbi:hypothetical protein T265_11266 [Opisthorchis viverrini]|uniref:Uncharacterized protein n=1 Tax=Opisthorchis viverrini TaxID=6198 RepID=A0A074ZY67_OPIVI|nr:hypothetical protein T265_11266 [Opisthorchis viverrini]KER20119.1 hypothetical protein T265_11266 [Opisthorchis viverrini]
MIVKPEADQNDSYFCLNSAARGGTGDMQIYVILVHRSVYGGISGYLDDDSQDSLRVAFQMENTSRITE